MSEAVNDNVQVERDPEKSDGLFSKHWPVLSYL